MIVRRSLGAAGAGSARCASPEAPRAAARGLSRPDVWSTAERPRFVVQKWVEGDVVTPASLAWNGREIAGFTRGRLEVHPKPLGAGSVVEFVGPPAVADATDRLFGLVGVHGLVGTQYIVDAATGIPYLMELNRRMLPATHSGPRVGIGLAAALRAAVDGVEWNGPPDLPEGPGMRLALFPQEWLRDSGSAWMRTPPIDVPWQDPGLFAATLRLGD